jgi:hypothetical protein
MNLEAKRPGGACQNNRETELEIEDGGYCWKIK